MRNAAQDKFLGGFGYTIVLCRLVAVNAGLVARGQ